MVRCAECGKLGEGSMEGWRAMLGTDVDDEDAPTEAYLSAPHAPTGSSGRLEPTTRSSRRSRPRPGEPSDEIGHNEDERDNDGDEDAQPDADTREGDERRSLDFARFELLAQPVGLLTRVRGETLRLFAQLAVQVELGVAAAKSALDGLVVPLTLISHLAPLVLVGHVPSLAEEPPGPKQDKASPACG
jgi:hypothetical protein